MIRLIKNLAFILSILAFTVTGLASTYVANANSGKFHYGDCRSVAKMNPSNKVFFNTREEAIDAGYIPCKICSP